MSSRKAAAHLAQSLGLEFKCEIEGFGYHVELVAPRGFQIEEDLHAKLLSGCGANTLKEIPWQEVLAEIREAAADLQHCPPGCFCGWDEEE